MCGDWAGDAVAVRSPHVGWLNAPPLSWSFAVLPVNLFDLVLSVLTELKFQIARAVSVRSRNLT